MTSTEDKELLELRASMEEMEKKLREEEKKMVELKKKLEEERAAKERALLKVVEKREPSETEKVEIRAIFDEFDADKTGVVHRHELKEVVHKLGCAMNDEELTASIEAMDTNKDGKISFDEFIEWYTSDEKLGGVAGTKLMILKGKLRAKHVAESIGLQLKRAKAAHAKRTDAKSVSTVELSVQVEGSSEAKMLVALSVVPSTKEVHAKALDAAFRAGVEKRHDSKERTVTVVEIVTNGKVKGSDLQEQLPAVAEEFALQLDGDILRIYMVGSTPIDTDVMTEVFGIGEKVSHNGSEAVTHVDVMEPMAASLTLSRTFEELVANRTDLFIHDVLTGLQFTGKTNANYNAFESLMLFLADDDRKSVTHRRRREQKLPGLIRAAALMQSENSVVFKSPDEVLTQTALMIAKHARQLVSEYLADESNDVSGIKNLEGARAWIDSDDFVLFVKRRAAIAISDYPIAMLQRLIQHSALTDADLRKTAKFARENFLSVKSITLTGTGIMLSATLENVNPFALLPGKDLKKVPPAKYLGEVPPEGVEELLRSCDASILDDLDFFDFDTPDSDSESQED